MLNQPLVTGPDPGTELRTLENMNPCHTEPVLDTHRTGKLGSVILGGSGLLVSRGKQVMVEMPKRGFGLMGRWMSGENFKVQLCARGPRWGAQFQPHDVRAVLSEE